MFKLSCLLSVLALSLLTSAYASHSTISCDSVLGTDRMLTLFVVDKDVKQMKIQDGPKVRFLIPLRLQNQNMPDTTLYTFPAVGGFMQVANDILDGNSGSVVLPDDEFICE